MDEYLLSDRQHGRLWRVAVVCLVAIPLMVLPSGEARADCVAPPDLDQALTASANAFVGSVAAVDFDGRVATFKVIEVWKGSIPEEVLVSGSLTPIDELVRARANGQEMWTSADRVFELGETYVVFAHGTDGTVLLDGGCSSTQQFTEIVAASRPDSARDPIQIIEPTPPAESESSGSTPLPAIAAVAIALAAITAMAIRGRRDNPDIW